MSGQIFISYSRVDTEFVSRLTSDLSAQSLDVWMDQSDIGAGQRWDSVIQNALETCGLFILVLSPHSVASENVLDELAHAINEKKRIIPILLKPCEIPYRIARIQFVDFTKNYQTGFNHLVSEITQPSPQRPVTVKKQAGYSPLLWAAGIIVALLLCAALLGGAYALYAFSTPVPEALTDIPTFTPTEPPTPTFTPTETPLPSGEADLVASGMQYFPDPAKNAQPIDIQVKVTNNGGADAGRFTIVWLSNQTRPGCDWTLPRLNAGESKTLSCQFTYDGKNTASYWTTLIVDSENQVAESDEANNRRDTTLKVAP